jgi:hypothetical protein
MEEQVKAATQRAYDNFDGCRFTLFKIHNEKLS